MVCPLLYGSLGSGAVCWESGCVWVAFVSTAACLCVWNECKRHQTPPLMGLINDRWNSCCFSHRSTVCSNRNKAQNVQRDWWGRLRLEISLMLSATIHTSGARKGPTLAGTCLHFAPPLSLRIAWNMHITNKLCWSLHTYVHTHSLTHSLIHTHLPKSFLCSSWGPSCSDVIACCHFADCDSYWKQSTLIWFQERSQNARASKYIWHTNTKIDICMHYAHTYTYGSYHQHTHTHTLAHVKRMIGEERKKGPWRLDPEREREKERWERSIDSWLWEQR